MKKVRLYEMDGDENLEAKVKEELKILRKLENKGYTISEIDEFVQGMLKEGSNRAQIYTVGKSHVKIGVFGDPHIGHKEYKRGLMKHFTKTCDIEEVDMVACTGDIFDGWYQNRPSSIFEQNAHGFDQQMELAVKELSQIKQPFYFITGNHSYNTFVRGAGVEAGPYLQDKLNAEGCEAHYLGNADGEIRLRTGTRIKLMHPDGGTAYALSYRGQKIVESFSGGEKPNILLIGHFHKAEYMFYRNVHVYQTATMCGQTKFMKGKGIPAHTGFWILDIFSNRRGQIDKIIQQFYPAYK